MSLRPLALCLLALVLPAAAAPWNPPPTLELGLGLGSPVPAPAPRPPAARPQPPGAANLVFKPAAAVSRRVEREVLDDLARRNRGQWGPRLEADLRLANLKAEFDLMLRLHGRSPTNLGDVLGAYLVLGWEGFSGEVASPEAMAAAALQWRIELRRREWATRPDAQKQALAETLAWRAMLAAGVARSARAQAAPHLFALREGLRREVLQTTGVDLARQRLTPRGFEMK